MPETSNGHGGVVPHYPEGSRTCWGLILKKKAGKCVSLQLLSRGMEKFHLVFCIRDITMAQIIASKRNALKEYRSLKLSSSALRTTFLEDLVAARA
jgi:hypothetical protein